MRIDGYVTDIFVVEYNCLNSFKTFSGKPLHRLHYLPLGCTYRLWYYSISRLYKPTREGLDTRHVEKLLNYIAKVNTMIK